MLAKNFEIRSKLNPFNYRNMRNYIKHKTILCMNYAMQFNNYQFYGIRGLKFYFLGK